MFLGQALFWYFLVKPNPAGATLGLVFACVILVLSRTDGFVFPLIGVAWLVVTGRYRLAGVILTSVIVTFVLIMLARLAYYGEFMPNTYYAKINGALVDRLTTAGRYLGSIALKNGLLIYAMAFGVMAIIVFWRMVRKKGFAPSFEVTAFGGIVAYYMIIGGDIYRDRFLLILFPLGLFLLWEVLTVLKVKSLAPWVMGAAILHQLSAFAMDRRLELVFEHPKYDRFVVLGQYLGTHHPGSILATGAAGKIPFYSGLQTIDMLGLNDLHIARVPASSATPGHGRFDTAYVLGRQPDLICDHVYGDGHMVYGLERETHEPAGYALTYLVKHRGMAGEAVVNVRNMARDDIAAAVDRGYRFGCLARNS